jgi:peptide/nickel transport system substrate-binding protein
MKRSSLVLVLIFVMMGTFLVVGPSYGAVTELRVAAHHDMNSADPARAHNTTDHIVNSNVFNGLLKLKPGSCEIEKDLAESYKVSSDGKVLTFKLRRGVKFHKGYGELISSDVKFSLMRYLDPKVKSMQQGNYEVMDRIETPDKYTVRIFLRKPSMGFLGVLAFSGEIVSEKAMNELGSKFSFDPIGTGAFQWSGRVPGSEIVLTAYEDYFLGPPEVKRVVCKIIPDTSVCLNAVQRGDVDYFGVLDSGSYRSMLNIKDKNFKVLKYNTTWTNFVYFNCEKEPTKHAKVRQAMAHAIDFRAIAKSFQGMMEYNPSAFPFTLPSWTDKLSTYRYDVELAKRLLREAGYERPSIEIDTFKFMNSDDFAIMIKDYLSKIMDVKIVMIDVARWREVATARKDWYLYTNPHSRPTEDLYASGTFHSKGSNNFMGYANPQLDAMIEKADQEVNDAKRKALYVNIQEIIARDLPLLVMSTGNGIAITTKNLEGVVGDGAFPGVAKFHGANFK